MQGLYGYLARNMRGKKGQAGFTLIELLVVVTILGVLAAIVTLSLVGLTTNAEAKACQQEYKIVQAALDAYMANNNVDTIAAGSGVSDMTSPIVLYNAAPTAGQPTYIRNTPTQYGYTWNTHGQITAIGARSGGPAPPTACAATP
jgi:prepilin-type N-terminal cleavage/methylation domain-containing protein